MIDQIILEDTERIRRDLKKTLFEGKRFLVTGGAGFLGSWLCDVLVGFNARVACLDNLSTGKLENTAHLLGNPEFKFINEDVCTFESDVKYDYILHLASRASPEEYQQHPIETLQTNSLGSYNMLELARKHDATILFTSTSQIYGDAEVVPTPETYWGKVNPTGFRSCYDEGKRFAESLFMAFHRTYGQDMRIIRVFNSYGPRIRADGPYARAISRFVTQTLANQPITIYGDGKQTRSFCYVSDTTVGLLLLLTSEKAKGEIINIGNSEEITILQLAQKIKKLAGSASPLTFYPLPKDDPRRRCPDITKAEKLLGWKPKISLEQGLLRTINWFRER